MTRVTVAEPVLIWALNRVANPDAIEERFPKLGEWIQGDSSPTLRQLQDFAKATRTPLGALFLSEPPDYRIHIPHFRTLTDKDPHRPSPDLIETIYTMERRQAWLRDYLIENGGEVLPFIKSAQAGATPKDIAKKMREAIRLEIGWASQQRTWSDALRLLQDSMDSAGISVVVNGIVGNNTHRKLDVQEFRGFVLVDDFAPVVFVNGADWKSAQIFTLAHELAHLIVGSSAAFDLREMLPADDTTEKLCNAAAAEFLVPQEEFRELWKSIHELKDRFKVAARHFKVSEIVIARRSLDLSFISREEFFVFYDEYRKAQQQRADDNDASGGNFHATQNFRLSKVFAETVIHAARQGHILYREAYQLTGLYGKTFEKYASTLGLGAYL